MSTIDWWTNLKLIEVAVSKYLMSILFILFTLTTSILVQQASAAGL